jgi:hypothetical protein
MRLSPELRFIQRLGFVDGHLIRHRPWKLLYCLKAIEFPARTIQFFCHQISHADYVEVEVDRDPKLVLAPG